MTNDPLIQILNAARRGGNPMQIIQQMAGVNPVAAQAARMMQGKNSAQLEQMARNMCKERGTTPEMVMQQLGLR